VDGAVEQERITPLRPKFLGFRDSFDPDKRDATLQRGSHGLRP